MKKTMKSAMKAAALMMMATVMSLGLASCDNDDDNKGTTAKITGAETTITVTPTTDSKDIAETVLEYTDENGQTKTQTAMLGLLSVKVKVSKLPANIDITVKQTAAAGAAVTRSEYELGAFLKTSTSATGQGLVGFLVKEASTNSSKKVLRADVPAFFQQTHIIKKTLVIKTDATGTGFSAQLK